MTDPKLVVVRGNSGSGKSTVAKTVRDAYGRGCALIEQDYLRRIVLRERDLDGGWAPMFIETVVRSALDGGYHVVLEGILHGARYKPMLERLRTTHRGDTYVFYLDVSLEETLRRHGTRPQATEFTPDEMRSWFVPHDVLGVPGEIVIREHSSLRETAALITATAGLYPPGSPAVPPAHHRRSRGTGQ